MAGIIAAIEALVGVLESDARVNRPVTADPRNLVRPGVLVEPPTMDTTASSLCGRRRGELKVYVVGMPGAWAEFQPLATLADAVLDAISDSDDADWSSAEFVQFQLPNEAGALAEPSMAYSITCEVFV